MKQLLRKILRRRNLDREIEAELALHRELAEADGNYTPLGNHLLMKERASDPWRFWLLESLWQDIVYGIRALRRAPLLALAAITATSLGIGSTTAVFSLVNAILLKPAPVPDPGTLVVLDGAATAPKFSLWREQAGVLQDVAAYSPTAMNLTAGAAVEEVNAMQVSADALRCWGTPVLLGRDFNADEDRPGGPHAVLLGETFWKRVFAGQPQVLGSVVSLNGDSYRVTGVVAHSAFLLEQGPAPDLYVPMQMDPNSTDLTRRFRMTARLRERVTLEQANARIAAAAKEYRARSHRAFGPQEALTAARYGDAEARANRPLLLILLGAVSLVLLIACANVANLLLVRGERRRREIAIRASIGAGRWRVIRQLLTESLLLSLLGGGLGLLLGFAGLRALLSANTAGLPRLGENGAAVSMDWRVMTFALAISILTGILFGLLPALSASRVDLQAVLKSGGSAVGIGRNKARAALAVTQVGLAVVLLISSALLIRTFVALYSVNTGLDTHNLITLRMRMTGAEFDKAARVGDAMRDGLERIRALPGVESATATYFIPLQTAIASTFDVVGQPPSRKPFIGWVPAASGYFEVFKIPLKAGRAFTERDDQKSAPVAIISETMARQFWRDADPLRDRIVIGGGGGQFRGEAPRQIIGIVGDVRDTQLANGIRPTMYVPQAQITDAMNALLARIQPVAWIVRTRGAPPVPSIREQLRQATGLPVAEIRSMEQVESSSVARQRFNMLVMSIFAGVALLLAAIGIYGLMAYWVEQRRREMGIRLALGAEPARVRRIVVAQGMSLALAGAGIGVIAALELTHFLASQLFGVQARDPLVFVGVPITLCAVALLAVWIPARRASRVDPVQALRFE